MTVFLLLCCIYYLSPATEQFLQKSTRRMLLQLYQLCLHKSDPVTRSCLRQYRKILLYHCCDLCISSCRLMICHHDDRKPCCCNLHRAKYNTVRDDICVTICSHFFSFQPDAHPVAFHAYGIRRFQKCLNPFFRKHFFLWT